MFTKQKEKRSQPVQLTPPLFPLMWSWKATEQGQAVGNEFRG